MLDSDLLRAPELQRDRQRVARAREPLTRYCPPPIVAEYADRFLERIDRPNLEDHYHDLDRYYATCWTWTGPAQRDGQAFFQTRGVKHPVQRFSYELWVAHCPPDFVARPVCETKLCVSYHHLRLRQRHPGTGLSAVARDNIRKLYLEPPPFYRAPMTMDQLAEMYGVSRTTIVRVVHG